MNSLWKIQNAPSNCANKLDAEAGINLIIINQKKKGMKSNAIDSTRHFKTQHQFLFKFCPRLFNK